MNEIQFLLYSMPDGDGKVQVVIKDKRVGGGINSTIKPWQKTAFT